MARARIRVDEIQGRPMSAVSVLLAPRDEAFGERIAGALARRGLSARLIAGDQADLFIDGHRGNGASIVVWSKAATSLGRLKKQAREALENGALIPVSIGGVPAPQGFENLPPIDLSGWRGDDDDPRWRFVLEAIDIASECRRRVDQDQWIAAHGEAPAPPPAETPAPILQMQEPPASEDAQIDAPAPDVGAIVTLQPPPIVAERKAASAPPTRANARRFDPSAVAVAGIMALCLITGAAIILSPSLTPAADPPQTPASEAPPLTPASDTPRVDLAMLQDAVAPATAFDEDEKIATTRLPPVDVFADAAAAPNDPYGYEFDDMEGFGEGDISYPDDFAGAPQFEPSTDSYADEIHLAMLGPASPTTEVPAPPEDAPTPAAQPDMPSLKPATPRKTATPATMDALLASVPELSDQVAYRSSVQGVQPAPTDYFKDCSICPDMVALAAGAFVMGPGPGERPRPNEGPATRVDLAQRFAIATREVTFAEWDACVADGGCAGYKATDFGWGRGAQPVVGVSFDDAQNYAAWLSEKTGRVYRLPSEAEWEFAARAGRATPFSFGVDLTAGDANYDGRYVYRGKKGRWIGHPTPASRYPANGFGLFDMHGNVWEWTADCWRKSLAGAPADGTPRGGVCGARTLKGGAFNTGGWRLRAAHRIGKPASAREMEIGFRVVRAVD